MQDFSTVTFVQSEAIGDLSSPELRRFVQLVQVDGATVDRALEEVRAEWMAKDIQFALSCQRTALLCG
jgi:hypothetical protein